MDSGTPYRVQVWIEVRDGDTPPRRLFNLLAERPEPQDGSTPIAMHVAQGLAKRPDDRPSAAAFGAAVLAAVGETP